MAEPTIRAYDPLTGDAGLDRPSGFYEPSRDPLDFMAKLYTVIAQGTPGLTPAVIDLPLNPSKIASRAGTPRYGQQLLNHLKQFVDPSYGGSPAQALNEAKLLPYTLHRIMNSARESHGVGKALSRFGQSDLVNEYGGAVRESVNKPGGAKELRDLIKSLRGQIEFGLPETR